MIVLQRFRSALVLALASSLLPQASAQLGFDTVLPSDTLAWYAIDDTDAAVEGFLATASARLFADPAFDALRTELEQGFAGLAVGAEEELGVDLRELFNKVNGSVAFALLQVGPASEPEAPGAVALALLVDLEEGSSEEVLELLDQLAERAVEEAPQELVFKFEELAGVEVSLLVDPGGEGTFSYAVEADTLIATLELGATQDELHLESLLLALSGDVEEALADNPVFIAAGLSEVGAPSRQRAWLNFPGLVRAGRRNREAKGEPISESIDLLDGLGALSMRFSADENGQSQHMAMTWGNEFAYAEAIAALNGSGAPQALEWMPADVELGVAADLDFASLFDVVLPMLSDEEPGAALALISGMSDFEAAFGFHPRDDLLEALSGQFGFFSREPAEGIDPGNMFGMLDSFALCVGLNDAAMLGEFFDAVIRSQGLHVARKREIFEGYEVFALPVFMGITLYYSLGGDVLTASTNGELVRDVLRRQANAELASLANEKSVFAQRSELPREATFLVATDMAASMEGLFEMPSAFSAALEAGNIDPSPIPWGDGEVTLDELVLSLFELMPSKQIVNKYLDGYSLATLQLNEDGVVVDGVSP